MFGSGLLRGLGVTLREFLDTYIDDIKRIPSRYAGGRKVIDQTTNLDRQTGLFTIQYPEERRKLPDRFRYIPMLIFEEDTGATRCTACGICAKVCPPQCIWIVRERDGSGKPVARAAEFTIDVSICMNCGLCAEFCPFDSIKMNHVFEITAQQRMPGFLYGLEQLRESTAYYAKTNPGAWAEEEAARQAKAKAAAARAEKPDAAGGVQASPAAVWERRPAEARTRAAARPAEAPDGTSPAGAVTGVVPDSESPSGAPAEQP